MLMQDQQHFFCATFYRWVRKFALTQLIIIFSNMGIIRTHYSISSLFFTEKGRFAASLFLKGISLLYFKVQKRLCCFDYAAKV